jgi:hypothetical protein
MIYTVKAKGLNNIRKERRIFMKRKVGIVALIVVVLGAIGAAIGIKAKKNHS